MKKFTLFLMYVFAASAVIAQYCQPTYSNLCSSGDYIHNFSFNTLSNQNTGCNGNTDNYIYYSSGPTTNVQRGGSYPFSIQSGAAYGQKFGIWIDLNQDGNFSDGGEFLYSSPSQDTVLFTGNLIIPMWASTGVTRLRIRSHYGSINSSDSCSALSWGETEDYDITILQAPPCTNPPVAGTAISSRSSVCNYYDLISFSLLGNTYGSGQSYQWQFSPDSITWTTISGATGETYSTYQNASTYYRCLVTCGASVASTSVFVQSVLTVETTNLVQPSNVDSCNGSVTFQITTGTPPYDYYIYTSENPFLYYDTITDNITISDLCIGNVTAYIYSNSCGQSVSVQINSPDTGIKISTPSTNSITYCQSGAYYYDSLYIAFSNIDPPSCDSIVYDINFGDGSVAHFSEDSFPGIYYAWQIGQWWDHLYASPGAYTVMITARIYPSGYSDTLLKTVTVFSCGNIIGSVYNDINNNCMQNTGEPGLSGIPVKLTQGSDVWWAWTDASGNYSFDVPVGSYTIEIGNNMGYGISCSGSLPHGTMVTSGNTTTENFALFCNGSFDVGVSQISMWSGFFPGQQDKILPHVGMYNNVCNVSIPGTVIMVLDPNITYDGPASGVPAPTVIPAATGDTLVWNVNDINNMGNFGYWDYAVLVTTNTTVQLGDTVCITMMVLPASGDSDPFNNAFTRCFEVGVAYDPNMKEVSPRGTGVQGFIPDTTGYLTYTVHFQNTGNAPATNIYIIDTIDENLNMATFEIIAASHPMQPFELSGRTMKFMFAGIMLPDSSGDEPRSHGSVSYRLKLKQGLAAGTEIKNTAHIYFDYNEAIVTNTVLNTIAWPLGIENNAGQIKVSVFPNPGDGIFTVLLDGASSSGNKEIIIYNVLGEVICTQKNIKNGTIVDLQKSPSGIYLMKIKDGHVMVSERIIRK